MLVFHELNLLALRPFVKKKNLFVHAPPSAHVRHFKNAQSHWELKGAVSQDFQTIFFFINRTHLGP